MTEHVGIEFTGGARGALAAARETQLGIAGVSKEAKVAAGQLALTERELGRTTRGALAGAGAFRGMGRSIAFASTAFLGAAGFISVVKSSINAAADLQKQLERNTEMFGVSGKAIEAWSKTAATSFGLSRGEALKFTNDIGQMLVPLGVAPKAAAGMSVEVVKLAANLASLRNEDPSDVLSKLEAGLRGRGTQLKAYGIDISQATLKTEAFRLGLVKASVDTGKVALAEDKLRIAQAHLVDAQSKYAANTTQVHQASDRVTTAQNALNKAVAGSVPPLTASQKALAALAVYQQAATRYTGEFSKHSDDLANKQRVLHAAIKNLEEEVGQALLPVVSSVVGAMGKWLSSSKNQAKVTHDVKVAVEAFKDAVAAAWPVVKSIAEWVKKASDAVGGFGNVLKIAFAVWVLTRITKIAGAVHDLHLALSALPATVPIAILLTVSVAGGLGLQKFLASHGIGAAGHPEPPAPISVDLPGAVTSRDASLKGGQEELIPVRANGRMLLYGTKSEIWWRVDSSGQPTYGIHVKDAASYLGLTVNELWAHRDVAMGNYRVVLKKRAAAVSQAVQGVAGGITGGANTLPATFAATHQTMGLAGFPAIDIFRDPGTVIGSPVDGVVTRLSGRPFSAGWSSGPGSAIGLSIYIQADDGDTYFLTHFGTVLVKPGERVKRGQPIGTVGPMQGVAPHIHEGRHSGKFTPTGPSITPPAGTPPPTTDLHVGTPPAKARVAGLQIVPQALTDQLAAAQRAVTRARPKGGSALEDAINDEIAVEERLIAAAKKAHAKNAQQRKEVDNFINARLAAIASLKASLERVRKAEAKKAATQEAHEDLVEQVVAGLGLTSAAATRAFEVIRARYENLSNTALKTILAAQKKARLALAAALKTAAADRTAGLDVFGTLLGFDQNLAVTTQDKWGRAVTSTIGAVAAKVKAALDQLASAIASGNPRRIAAAIKAWENLGPSIASAVQAGLDAAAAKLQAAQDKFGTAFSRLTSRILTAFDRETSRELGVMQKGLQQQVDGLQKALDARIAAMQKALARKIAQITAAGQALTPSERALKDLTAAHDAAQAAQSLADAQQALADAQKGGDPQAIKQAQAALDEIIYQQRVADLQKLADAERAARDKSTQDQIQKLQDAEAAQEASLQAQLAAQIQELQDAETAREQDFQDQRDAQRTALEDQLADWNQKLLDKTASWSDFINWLNGQGASGALKGVDIADPVRAMAEAGQAQGSAFAQAYIAELHAAWEAYQAFLNGQQPVYHPPAFTYRPPPGRDPGHGPQLARGGKVPGQYVGREDTVLGRLTPGETVIPRGLTQALEQLVARGGLGGGFGRGGPLVNIEELHIYGGTERQVHEGLSRALIPYLGRVSSYNSPI